MQADSSLLSEGVNALAYGAKKAFDNHTDAVDANTWRD